MSATPLRLGLIFGGRSGEHEVSLMSARSLRKVLDPRRYTVTEIGISQSGAWYGGEGVLEALSAGNTRGLQPVVLRPEPGETVLYAIRADGLEKMATLDVLLPLLHGSFGEDGAIQGYLELADVAYVGAGVLASAVGMDKSLFKDVMRAQGIPVARSLTFSRADAQNRMEAILQECEGFAAYPLFVKPANLGSSVGISKARNRSDLYEGLLDAARFDRRIVVEAAIPHAREFEVSVLGNHDPLASVPGEVVPGDDFYSYNAKYFSNDSKLIIPAALDEAKSEEMRVLAVRVYKAIDCAGMGRIDFLMNGDTGEIFVSEINTIPGYTQISMYPKLWEATGLGYADLVDRLVGLALERKAERDATERSFRRGT